MLIIGIRAREILDSRGNPTVEVDLTTEQGLFRAAVPSGASTGIYEAVELRDKNSSRYNKKGVDTAVTHVNEIIAPVLKGKSVLDQKEIDRIMVEDLDGSQNEWGFNKGKIGANAILGVSMAACRAGAAARNLSLYAYLATLSNEVPIEGRFRLPVPSFNVINGGGHAGNKLACQEFMIMPVGAPTFKEALRVGSEVYHTLQGVVKQKYGVNATNVGDEGGFAIPVLSNEEAFEVLMQAIEKSGHKDVIKIGIDVAASEFYCPSTQTYDLDYKTKDETKKTELNMSPSALVEYYHELTKKYPLASIEDPFDQDDWDSYTQLQSLVGDSTQIVGDDLLVTNVKRIELAQQKKACNALLLKINQIGTVTEAIGAVQAAKAAGWGVMQSHRSGETEDTFIADMAVGLGVGQIKTGAPCRSERTAKYNQLLRIEEELGDLAVYSGAEFRKCGNV